MVKKIHPGRKNLGRKILGRKILGRQNFVTSCDTVINNNLR